MESLVLCYLTIAILACSVLWKESTLNWTGGTFLMSVLSQYYFLSAVNTLLLISCSLALQLIMGYVHRCACRCSVMFASSSSLYIQFKLHHSCTVWISRDVNGTQSVLMPSPVSVHFFSFSDEGVITLLSNDQTDC
jgi:hypothetical protein